MPVDRLTIEQFAQKVKAKYPEYRDVNDSLLVEKMVAKYPEYKERIITQREQPQQPKPEQPVFKPMTDWLNVQQGYQPMVPENAINPHNIETSKSSERIKNHLADIDNSVRNLLYEHKKDLTGRVKSQELGINPSEQGPINFQAQQLAQKDKQDVYVSPIEVESFKSEIPNNPVLLRRGLEQKAKDLSKTDPIEAATLKADIYRVDRQNNPEKENKISKNVEGIKNGELDYDIVNGQLVKPEGFLGSLATGYKEKVQAFDDYGVYQTGDKKAILDLINKRLKYDPDEAAPQPKGEWVQGFFNEMARMAGGQPLKPLIGGAAASIAGPEAGVAAASAITAPEMYKLTFGATLPHNYAAIKKAHPDWSEEQQLQEAIDFTNNQANIDALSGAAMGVLGAKLGLKPTGLNSGLLQKSLGSALKQVGQETVKKTLEGLGVGTIGASGQLVKNLMAQQEGIPIDESEGLKEQLLGGLKMTAGMHMIAKFPELLKPKTYNQLLQSFKNVPKEQVESELNNLQQSGQITEEQAKNAQTAIKQHADIDNSIKPNVPESDRLKVQEKIKKRNELEASLETTDKAYHPDIKEQIKVLNEEIVNLSNGKERGELQQLVDKESKDENIKGFTAEALKDASENDLKKYFKEISEQAYDPNSEATTLATFGENIVNKAKELYPQEQPKESSISVIQPGEIKHPEIITIKPKEDAIQVGGPEAAIVDETSGSRPKMEPGIPEPGETTIPQEGGILTEEGKATGQEGIGGAGKPPTTGKGVDVADYGEGGKELDKLANNVPDSGKVAEYMSKGTIEKYTGEIPTNDQSRGVQELGVALEHGEKIIEKAKELFGNDYAEKTLEYIDNSKAGISNKALMYVSLENALGREKLAFPERSAEIAKQQALVYEKSQAFARENSLALNYQKLRRIAKVGYDINKVTESFFSPEEIEGRKSISKSIEADADAINKQAEEMEVAQVSSDVERAIREGVAKEIEAIHKNLPKEKQTLANKAIEALDKIHNKLRGKTYESTLGIPVAIIDGAVLTIKNAIKAGVKIADAIELGISKIKEKYKDWANEEEFRKDMITGFKEYGINEHSSVESTHEYVKKALIDQGFGREKVIKGEKKQILDWKKLAGAAGTVSKISENVGNALEKDNLTEAQLNEIKDSFIKEYIDLRTSVIEKAQTELARRNKETVTPEQKSAARKLAELYTYGLFDSQPEIFENTLNKALGASVSEKGFNEAMQIAKGMETLYSSTFKGNKLSDISAKAAIEHLDNQMRQLLARESKKQGNFNYKAANIVRSYFDLQQTMILNNVKQLIENPLSGLQQNIIETIGGKLSKEGIGTPEMGAQRRGLMKDIYRGMVLKGDIGYGKTENTFVNRTHIDDYINKLSDNQLYHGVMSALSGKATLNAADAMFKAAITEKKFAGNLIKILTHETNPKKMSKSDAVAFVSEKLTGQTMADAKVSAKQIIDKINKDAGKGLIPVTDEAVNRFANDIVKSALEMGGKITTDQITAAYNAAYKAAGLGLGHEPNNILSSTILGYSSKLETKINEAVKNKEWNRAAILTANSILFRNIWNPFIGGGTNWLVLKFEKTGLGLVTGLGYKLATNTKIDLSSELGMKTLEKRLYNQSRIKDNYMRGLVGGAASALTYLAFTGLANTDEYRKWRGKNQWAAKYLDIITPEMLLTKMSIENKSVKKYLENTFNKNDAFESSAKFIKAADYAVRGEKDKAWGAVGEAIGSKFNVPLPWRLVKDGQVIYQGITGQDPYHGNYKPSIGFMNGVFQGGAIEWLGYRPGASVSTAQSTTPSREKPTRIKPTRTNPHKR